RRHVVAGNVLAEVFNPSVNTPPCSYCRSLSCDVPVGIDHTFADELSCSDVVVVEVMQEIEKEGWPVRLNRSLYSFEDTRLHTLWIICGFHEVRSQCSDYPGLANASGTVFTQVAGDLTGTHGKTHQINLLKIKCSEHRVKIGGKGIVVIADRRL